MINHQLRRELKRQSRLLSASEYFSLELADDKDILIKRLEYENDQLRERVKWLEKGIKQYNRFYWETCEDIGKLTNEY